MARLHQRKCGKVIWFNLEERYGFLSSETLPNVFLHISQINERDAESILPGSLVEFDIGYSAQGLFALNVGLVAANNNLC